MQFGEGYANQYFRQHYLPLMKSFSLIYAQVECEKRDDEEAQIAAVVAYYTVIAHIYFGDDPTLSQIEKYLKEYKGSVLDEFGQELAKRIFLESHIHDCEYGRLVTIDKGPEYSWLIELTEAGELYCQERNIDLETLIYASHKEIK